MGPVHPRRLHRLHLHRGDAVGMVLGHHPVGEERPRRSQFTGNDLSHAKPRRVLFRNGVDLSSNRLPEVPITCTWTASASGCRPPGWRSRPGPTSSAATPRASLTSTTRTTWTSSSAGGVPSPTRRPRCGPSWRPSSYPDSRRLPHSLSPLQPHSPTGCKCGWRIKSGLRCPFSRRCLRGYAWRNLG
jgi:hypothetical protein